MPSPDDGCPCKGEGEAQGSGPKVVQSRLPRTAAISLTIGDGSKLRYAEVMSSGRKINLADLGIAEVRPKSRVVSYWRYPDRRGLARSTPSPENSEPSWEKTGE